MAWDRALRGAQLGALVAVHDRQSYLPFALNVLTLRGEQISDVTAFVARVTDAPDRSAYANWPTQPADPERLLATVERFGLPSRLAG